MYNSDIMPALVELILYKLSLIINKNNMNRVLFIYFIVHTDRVQYSNINNIYII